MHVKEYFSEKKYTIEFDYLRLELNFSKTYNRFQNCMQILILTIQNYWLNFLFFNLNNVFKFELYTSMPCCIRKGTQRKHVFTVFFDEIDLKIVCIFVCSLFGWPIF